MLALQKGSVESQFPLEALTEKTSVADKTFLFADECSWCMAAPPAALHPGNKACALLV